jgi:hypothetical protein
MPHMAATLGPVDENKGSVVVGTSSAEEPTIEGQPGYDRVIILGGVSGGWDGRYCG